MTKDALHCRLKAEQMEAVFERKKRLLPRSTDLSFYNWDTQMATSNATANFQVPAVHKVTSHADAEDAKHVVCCRL